MTGHFEHWELLARIGTGAVLGGIIGYERDRHGRPVGLRTHLLVAMTAATFMVVSSQFAYFQRYAAGDIVEVDGSRIAASVVSGIGFLAGGAILRTGATIQGLTTAAGLWLVTAIGLCAGAGMYTESIAVTGMGVVALTVLRRFEDKNDLVVRRQLEIVLEASDGGEVQRVLAALGALGIVVSELEYDRELGDRRVVRTRLEVQIPAILGTAKLVQAIEGLDGIRRVRVHQP